VSKSREEHEAQEETAGIPRQLLNTPPRGHIARSRAVSLDRARLSQARKGRRKAWKFDRYGSIIDYHY
jgi:hypothetical protein